MIELRYLLNYKQTEMMAAEAYRIGKTQEDNPYHLESQHYQVWKNAWHNEYAWWEDQMGINPHGR